jgi:hypothetical protein
MMHRTQIVPARTAAALVDAAGANAGQRDHRPEYGRCALWDGAAALSSTASSARASARWTERLGRAGECPLGHATALAGEIRAAMRERLRQEASWTPNSIPSHPFTLHPPLGRAEVEPVSRLVEKE